MLRQLGKVHVKYLLMTHYILLKPWGKWFLEQLDTGALLHESRLFINSWFDIWDIFSVWLLQNSHQTMLRVPWRYYVFQLLLLCRWAVFLLQIRYTLIDHFTYFCKVNQEIVNKSPEVFNKIPSRELTVHIDRFAYIFRYDPVS